MLELRQVQHYIQAKHERFFKNGIKHQNKIGNCIKQISKTCHCLLLV